MKKRIVRLIPPIRGRGWRLDWHDHLGQRHRPCFDSKDLALAEQSRIEVRLAMKNAGIQAPLNYGEPRQPMTLKNGIQHYVHVKKAERVGDTPAVEKCHFEHLYVYLSNKFHVQWVHEIAQAHIDSLRADLRIGDEKTPGKKASTVNRYFSTYGAFLNLAREWGWFAHGSEPLKKRTYEEEEPDIKVWPAQDMKRALSLSPDWAKGPLYFLIETGCRPIEVERLRYKDLDFARRLVFYVSYKGGKIKTKHKGLSDGLAKYLFQKCSDGVAGGKTDEDLVFLTPNGGCVGKDNLNHVLRRLGIIKKGGLSLYGLRHTFGDNLVDQGVHLTDIGELMGHAKGSDITTKYTHRKGKPTLQLHVNTLSAERAKLGVSL